MWKQAYNIRSLAIPSAYVAMFDECNEGTAIFKAAENASMIPTNRYFLTLDADGVSCSSDFYLRLVGDEIRMIKGFAPAVAAHPTAHQGQVSVNYRIPTKLFQKFSTYTIRILDLNGRMIRRIQSDRVVLGNEILLHGCARGLYIVQTYRDDRLPECRIVCK
jgi:hypothetical protein